MALPNIAKRQAFVQHYAASGNATRAAIAAGCPDGSASVTAHRWLRNPAVLALLRDEINLYLRDLAPGALKALRHLVECPDTPAQTRLAAARDVLDRVGFVAPKRAELAVTVAEKPIQDLSRSELERIANGEGENRWT
jgi:phage terminase small subunit